MRKMYGAMCAALTVLVFSCGSVKPAANNPSMIADIDPLSLGSVTASLERMFSNKLKEVDMEVVFIPRKNEVSLEFRHELLINRQFWSEAARRQFIEALNQYNENFDNKKLVNDYKKSRAAYGKNSLRYEWETAKYFATYRSSPPIELGYRFKDNAVYFTVLLRSAKEETSDSGRTTDSQQYSVYFTRTQAGELAKLFDQDYLLALAGGSQETLPPDDTGKDIYIP